MPSNAQKRAAAKRKLQRQLERRAERARRRRQATVLFAVVAVVLVAGAGAWYWTTKKHPDEPKKPPVAAAAQCAFSKGSEPASKEVTLPANGPATLTPATTEVTVKTDQGAIPLTLNRAQAPCAVQSFISLAQQNFFDGSHCHRLTSGGLSVLQCGDPSGTGSGGPGYSFADEYPTKGTAAAAGTTLYKRGTLAMANAGPNTNGSQFFLVYQDSQLAPNYTIFGTISEPGLAVLDKVAAGGIVSKGQDRGDGAPKIPVTITGVDLVTPGASSMPEQSAPAQPPMPAQPAPQER